MEGGLLLDVVVGQGAAILQLLAGEDEALLVRRDALLVLDLSLDIVDGVRALHLQSDALAGEGLDKDLHLLNRIQRTKYYLAMPTDGNYNDLRKEVSSAMNLLN